MTQDRGQGHIHLSLDYDPRAPGRVRSALESLRDRIGNRFDLVQLLATEVVTNAILHADGWSSETKIDFTAEVEGQKIRVVVIDDGPGLSTSERPPTMPSPLARSGRGLVFLDELADAWGNSLNGRHAVWFELETDPVY